VLIAWPVASEVDPQRQGLQAFAQRRVVQNAGQVVDLKEAGAEIQPQQFVTVMLVTDPPLIGSIDAKRRMFMTKYGWPVSMFLDPHRMELVAEVILGLDKLAGALGDIASVTQDDDLPSNNQWLAMPEILGLVPRANRQPIP